MHPVSNKVLPWLTAARPVAHGMIALPLIFGQGLALAVSGQFLWPWCLAAQLFGLLIQVHSLYLNDYADERLDRNNHDYWLSGGSRVIPDGKLTGAQLYKAAHVVGLFVVLLAIVATVFQRPWALLFAMVALLASGSYSLPPVKSAYRGWGELHQGLSCGVGLPLFAYYLQVGSLQHFPWLILLPLFLIFFAANIVTALPDIASDALGGKHSYPVRHGAITAKQRAVCISLLAAMLALVFVIQSVASVMAALTVTGVPIGLFLWMSVASLAQSGDSVDNKRFMLLIMLGQLWLLTFGTAVLFWML